MNGEKKKRDDREKREVEEPFVRQLRSITGPNDLANFKIRNSTSNDVRSLFDLCRTIPFGEPIQDNSCWNLHKGFMEDVSGGLTPDIVLRSEISGENRIVIEAKLDSPLRDKNTKSQVVRYFLHLIATSKEKPKGKTDIRRAVLLLAPTSWFENPKTGASWKYFKMQYRDLADAFGVTLGEIHWPDDVTL